MVKCARLSIHSRWLGTPNNHPLIQTFSVFAAAPALISALELIYSRRRDLLHFIRLLPRFFLAEVLYLATGKELGDPVHNSQLSVSLNSLEAQSPVQAGETDWVLLQRVTTTSPEISSSRSPARISGKFLAEEPNQLGDSTLCPPVLTELEGDHTLSERVRPPAPLTVNVPLAMLKDIIPILPQNESIIESFESICTTHGLDPPVKEFVMEITRGDHEKKWCVVRPQLPLARVYPTFAIDPAPLQARQPIEPTALRCEQSEKAKNLLSFLYVLRVVFSSPLEWAIYIYILTLRGAE